MHTTFHEHSLSHIWKSTWYYANTPKQMKFSGVLDTNWEQFFIYFNFNCTIA